MKSGTESKLKFKQLQRRLDLPLWQARGLLDTLWKFVAENCPTGDLGRYTVEEIAIGIDWRGEPSTLIEALLEFRWLDRTAEQTLVVHDWAEHCEDGVHKSLARKTELFCDGTMPSLSRFRQDERSEILSSYKVRYGDEVQKTGNAPARPETHENAPTKPCQTKPNLAPPPPNHARPRANSAAAAEYLWPREEKAELIAELQRRGLGRAIAAVNDAERNGETPNGVRSILVEYDANKAKFTSPGAISDRIKTGCWPAAVAAGPEVAAKAARKQAKANPLAGVLFEIVEQGRADGRTDSDIKAKLRAKLPADYCEAQGW